MANTSFGTSGREASGRQSSLSVQGETLGRATPHEHISKSYRYRVVGHESSVDETLFGSHRSRNQTGTADGESSNPPSQKASQRGVRKSNSPAIKPQLSSMPKTRNKYRIVKHTPTYVDQSLFGGPLEEPSFEAPWTDMKEERRRNATLMWGPPVAGSLDFEARSGSAIGERPASVGRTRLATGSRPGSAARSRPGSAGGSRPGSAAGSRPGSASGTRPGSACRNHRRSSTGSRPTSASGRRSDTPSKPAPWR